MLRLQNHDTSRFSLEQVQFFPLFALAFMDTDGYLAVDLCARNLFQDRSTLSAPDCRKAAKPPCASSMERVNCSKPMPVCATTRSGTSLILMQRISPLSAS